MQISIKTPKIMNVYAEKDVSEEKANGREIY